MSTFVCEQKDKKSMNVVNDDLLSKVKKLLNKSDSSRSIGSIDEANAFFSKANDLLVSRGLSLSDVEKYKLKDSGRQAVIDTGFGIEFGTKKCYGKWEIDLLSVISNHFMCRVVYRRHFRISTNKKGNRTTVGAASIIGTNENIQTSKFIYDYMSDCLFNWAKRDHKKTQDKMIKIYGLTSTNPAELGLMSYRETWIKSYLRGAIDSITNKLRHLKMANERNEQIYGLVHVMGAKVDEFIAESDLYKDVKSVTPKSVKSDKFAFNVGYEAAKVLNVSKGIEEEEEIKSLNDRV